MKTLLAVFAVILGIIFLYFVVNAEKSILVNGSEVTPTGTDIPKLILNKAKELATFFTGGEVKNSADSAVNTFQPKITDLIQTGVEEFKNKAENLISGVASKITDLIKDPIKNKINEVLCPIK